MLSIELIPSKTFFNLVHVLAIFPFLFWLGMNRGVDVHPRIYDALIFVSIVSAAFHLWRYSDKVQGFP